MGPLMYTAAMTPVSSQIADAAPGNWVDRFLPKPLRPYARLARLDRPIGWWLLLLPCWWGLLLGQIKAGETFPNLLYAALFLLGAIVMRGAGCALNDIADRDFDSQVARTRSRPIPSGQISVKQAVVFLVAQALTGLLILIQFNSFTIALGAASLIIVAIYPFMKRITWWPQMFLGLAFNWGALVGWSATHGNLAAPAVALYLGGIFWTLAYDTIYAQQDKQDDALIGVKSTALKFGSASIYWIAGFFAAALVFLDLALWLAGAFLFAHIGVAGAALHGAWQVSKFKADDPQSCLDLFRSNRIFGLLITASLLLDLLIP